MRRPFTLAIVGALAFSAVAAGEVNTEHPCYDEATNSVVLETEQVWFHRAEAPVANASSAAPWDTTKPTASVQGGAGALALSSAGSLGSLAGDDYPATEAVFAGDFTGCLGVLAIDLFSFDPTNRSGTSGSAAPAAHNFGLSVVVDGTEVITGGPFAAKTTFANEGFGPNRNQFAVNVGAAVELYSEYSELEIDGKHTIEIRVTSWFANTGHSAYLWDTSEVPSGMTINATDLTDYPVVG